MQLYHSLKSSLWLVVLAQLVVTATAFPLDGPLTVFQNRTEFYEGDACRLPGTPPRTGICKKAGLCPGGIGRNAVHCEFSVHDAVVCCPTGDLKNPGTGASMNRFTVGIAKQECDRLQSRSAPLADHVSGNRKEVILGEYPFMAFVKFVEEDASNLECGASLISKRFLLTAAHCFHDYQPASVLLGAVVNNDPEAIEYPVKKLHLHEGNKRRQNDIALLELQDDVTFDSHLSPICLDNGALNIDPSVNLTVAGWGRDGSGIKTNKLFKGTVNRINLDQCRTQLRSAMYQITLTEKHMCALGGKSEDNGDYTDACGGDSGGPLIMSVQDKFYLVGIVSFGPGCGGALPGIYTTVSHYIDWIEPKVWGK